MCSQLRTFPKCRCTRGCGCPRRPFDHSSRAERRRRRRIRDRRSKGQPRRAPAGKWKDHSSRTIESQDLAEQSFARRSSQRGRQRPTASSHTNSHTRDEPIRLGSSGGSAAWAFGSTWRRMGGRSPRGHAIRAARRAIARRPARDRRQPGAIRRVDSRRGERQGHRAGRHRDPSDGGDHLSSQRRADELRGGFRCIRFARCRRRRAVGSPRSLLVFKGTREVAQRIASRPALASRRSPLIRRSSTTPPQSWLQLRRCAPRYREQSLGSKGCGTISPRWPNPPSPTGGRTAARSALPGRLREAMPPCWSGTWSLADRPSSRNSIDFSQLILLRAPNNGCYHRTPSGYERWFL